MPSKKKFPVKRSDGSFSIEIVFENTEGIDIHIIQNWLSYWNTENQQWVRYWRSGPEHHIVETNEMILLDAFEREPYISSVTELEIFIKLDVTRDSGFWKDWLGKFSQDLRRNFPSLIFKAVKNTI